MKVINAGSPKQEEALMRFGTFLGVNEITYVDTPGGFEGEDYIFTKDGESWKISVRGNKVDGPFANFYS